MGDTTDDLVALAKEVTSKPYGREMDRLLSTGEQDNDCINGDGFQRTWS